MVHIITAKDNTKINWSNTYFHCGPCPNEMTSKFLPLHVAIDAIAFQLPEELLVGNVVKSFSKIYIMCSVLNNSFPF